MLNLDLAIKRFGDFELHDERSEQKNFVNDLYMAIKEKENNVAQSIEL